MGSKVKVDTTTTITRIRGITRISRAFRIRGTINLRRNSRINSIIKISRLKGRRPDKRTSINPVHLLVPVNPTRGDTTKVPTKGTTRIKATRVTIKVQIKATVVLDLDMLPIPLVK
jgi:hypothetical protein